MEDTKCKSWCCSNYKEHGNFVGEFCSPCYEKITTGIGKYGTAWFFQLGDRIDTLDNVLQQIKNVINPRFF